MLIDQINQGIGFLIFSEKYLKPEGTKQSFAFFSMTVDENGI